MDFSRKTATDYVFEHGGKIINDTKVLAEADEALMRIGRIGGNPLALASGALYHVCKNRKIKLSKKQIGEAFKISHRTVYTNEARIRMLLQQLNIQKIQTAPSSKMPLLTIRHRTRPHA